MNAGATAQGDEQIAYTTVLSLLQVMEQKGFVGHRREGKAYVYLPRIQRQSTIRQIAGTFLERVFDGAVDEYLVHALESKRLSTAELDQLDAMLAQARERRPKAVAKEDRNDLFQILLAVVGRLLSPLFRPAHLCSDCHCDITSAGPALRSPKPP